MPAENLPMPCCICSDVHENSIRTAPLRKKGKGKNTQALFRCNLSYPLLKHLMTMNKETPPKLNRPHCVKKSFFFLTIISKHICTTPFDCFDLEW